MDDDAVFNYTTTVALNRANLDVVCVQDPTASLQTMQTDRFDIVLLDINMPGMDGFSVRKALRQIPAYKSIPVIFVRSTANSRIVPAVSSPVAPICLSNPLLRWNWVSKSPCACWIRVFNLKNLTRTAQRVFQRRQHPNRALISEANYREPSKFQRRTEGETETLRIQGCKENHAAENAGMTEASHPQIPGLDQPGSRRLPLSGEPDQAEQPPGRYQESEWCRLTQDLAKRQARRARRPVRQKKQLSVESAKLAEREATEPERSRNSAPAGITDALRSTGKDLAKLRQERERSTPVCRGAAGVARLRPASCGAGEAVARARRVEAAGGRTA